MIQELKDSHKTKISELEREHEDVNRTLATQLELQSESLRSEIEASGSNFHDKLSDFLTLFECRPNLLRTMNHK